METLARNWWALVLRGIAGVIFGVLTFINPGMTLAVLIVLFGAYAIVDGVFNLVAAVSGRITLRGSECASAPSAVSTRSPRFNSATTCGLYSIPPLAIAETALMS